jgi:hypothetical protein
MRYREERRTAEEDENMSHRKARRKNNDNPARIETEGGGVISGTNVTGPNLKCPRCSAEIIGGGGTIAHFFWMMLHDHPESSDFDGLRVVGIGLGKCPVCRDQALLVRYEKDEKEDFRMATAAIDQKEYVASIEKFLSAYGPEQAETRASIERALETMPRNPWLLVLTDAGGRMLTRVQELYAGPPVNL